MSDDDANTGLAFARSWRSIYLFVIAIFAIYVAVLALLPRLFT